uniref:(northern house mosquito) hypothetical protein n=1 Tax=Culex pipiens TaxID=7175 RepID=A0A8D8ERY8_CULPI
MDSFFSPHSHYSVEVLRRGRPNSQARTWPQFHKHRVAHNPTHTHEYTRLPLFVLLAASAVPSPSTSTSSFRNPHYPVENNNLATNKSTANTQSKQNSPFFFYFKHQNPSLFSCFSHSTFFIFFAFLDFFFGKMRQSRKNKHKSHPNSQKITAKRAHRTATAGGDRKRTGRWPTGAGSDPGNHVF